MAGKPKGAAGSKQGQRQQQQQQPARRRLRKAGSDNAGATSAAAPEAKRRRTSAKAARGTAGSVAEGPAGSADGAGAAQGRAGSKAAPAAAAVPPVPPPPADLQALGRKHTPGYTISLSRRRSNLQQQSGSDARQPKQAATQHAQPEVPAAAAEGQGQLQHQDSGSAGAAGRPAWRRAAASAAAGEETANQAATAPGQPSVQEREAAEKLLAELQQLQAVVRREEELLVGLAMHKASSGRWGKIVWTSVVLIAVNRMLPHLVCLAPGAAHVREVPSAARTLPPFAILRAAGSGSVGRLLP